MYAIRFHQTGGPDVLTRDDVPTPEPGPGEVLIRVAVAGVNYADLLQRQGAYPIPGGLPAIPGFEVAGTVVAHGPGVSAPPIGARVVSGLQGGGYAEYIATPAAVAIPIPNTLGFAEATALFVQGLTAYGLLTSAGRLQPGETVLVHAAAGGVGSLAVQLAKARGATVIGTAGATAKLDLIRSLGADAAVDYRRSDWAEAVRAATGGRGVDLALESVGGAIGAATLDLLATGGRLVVYGAASGEAVDVPTQALVYRGLSVVGYSMGVQTAPAEMAAGMQALVDASATGQLKPVIGLRLPLAEAAAAHRAMGERSTTGKVVLDVA
jgi:NADPH2:quinone reductase